MMTLCSDFIIANLLSWWGALAASMKTRNTSRYGLVPPLDAEYDTKDCIVKDGQQYDFCWSNFYWILGISTLP